MSDSNGTGRVVSVNVGLPRTVEWFGRKVTTAIWKAPVDGAVPIADYNFEGDRQADGRVHGGPDKAIYAYAIEDYQWWSVPMGEDLGPGTFGDNLTTQGIDLRTVVVGERWQLGSTVLEVSQPRLPCFKLGIRMGDSGFVDLFDEVGRFGTYLRIVTYGAVTAGDAIARLDGPAGGVTIADLVEAHHSPTPELMARIAAAEEVPESWRAHARRAVAR